MTIEEALKAGLVRPTTSPNEDAPADTAGSPVDSARIPTLDYARDIGRNAAARLARAVQVEDAPDATAPRVTEAEAAAVVAKSLGVDAPASLELPNPELDSDGSSAPPQQPKFVCAADGKTFSYRSHLKKHVLRKYKDRVDELMAPYPEAGNRESTPA
jgi:hypothetical protein